MEMPLSLRAREASRLDIHSIHQAHADFVWRTLQHMGVRPADVEDQMQEVFVVVHNRLRSFDASSRMTTWLFGICMRVAAAYRRRAHRRREQVVADVPEQEPSDEGGPESPAPAAFRAPATEAVTYGSACRTATGTSPRSCARRSCPTSSGSGYSGLIWSVRTRPPVEP
jgi:DNA-directed RNA polymerase specialized sigma24 family protein